jgi:sulfatase maturation enzyme AslB (radical SAM superfamily)
MAISKSKVRKTKSGVFVRHDEGCGLLAHSPFTGLTYGVSSSETARVATWLDRKIEEAPSDLYRLSLGAGWAIPLDQSQHPIPHLLPDQSAWPTLPTPQNPIVINWFITGRCPLECTYCYAEDLMRNEEAEPGRVEIRQRAEAILKLQPLVVVLTGGDPLFSPYLSEAITILSGRVGIVLDTSGYTLTPRHVQLLAQH